MMSLNKSAGTAMMILYACATIALSAVSVSALTMPDRTISSSANIHNITDHNDDDLHKNNRTIEKDETALSATLSQQLNNKTSDNAVGQQRTPFKMEKYLHLDERNLVATTPRIHTTKLPNRYEQGLEDYEEAVARVDKIKEQQQAQQQYAFGGLETILSLLETATNVWDKVTTEYDQRNVTSTTKQSTIIDKLHDERTDDDLDANNRELNATTDVAEARYIQGDPLKGYYDFIITEGSYKFWAGFQLFTAGLMIYSTFAAIYYSKVNPVVGDYDYTAYLGWACSMADDPEPLQTSSPWSEVSKSYIFQTAAHGFQFVLDAIEKIPK